MILIEIVVAIDIFLRLFVIYDFGREPFEALALVPVI
jgi:hypothetical protein